MLLAVAAQRVHRHALRVRDVRRVVRGNRLLQRLDQLLGDLVGAGHRVVEVVQQRRTGEIHSRQLLVAIQLHERGPWRHVAVDGTRQRSVEYVGDVRVGEPEVARLVARLLWHRDPILVVKIVVHLHEALVHVALVAGRKVRNARVETVLSLTVEKELQSQAAGASKLLVGVGLQPLVECAARQVCLQVGDARPSRSSVRATTDRGNQLHHRALVGDALELSASRGLQLGVGVATPSKHPRLLVLLDQVLFAVGVRAVCDTGLGLRVRRLVHEAAHELTQRELLVEDVHPNANERHVRQRLVVQLLVHQHVLRHRIRVVRTLRHVQVTTHALRPLLLLGPLAARRLLRSVHRSVRLVDAPHLLRVSRDPPLAHRSAAETKMGSNVDRSRGVLHGRGPMGHPRGVGLQALDRDVHKHERTLGTHVHKTGGHKVLPRRDQRKSLVEDRSVRSDSFAHVLGVKARHVAHGGRCHVGLLRLRSPGVVPSASTVVSTALITAGALALRAVVEGTLSRPPCTHATSTVCKPSAKSGKPLVSVLAAV